MFDSDLDRDESSGQLRRRAFLISSAAAAAGVLLWSLKKPRILEASAPKGTPQEVTIVQFSDAGARLKTVHVPKVVKSEDEEFTGTYEGVETILEVGPRGRPVTVSYTHLTLPTKRIV